MTQNYCEQNNQNNQMDGCCPPKLNNPRKNKQANKRFYCPVNKQKGKKVDIQTLQSLLQVSLSTLRNVQYFFCSDPNCDVVYYAADQKQTFTRRQLSVRVYQKEPDDETVPVCYCFCHSPASIRLEFINMGKSTVIEDIQMGIKASQCACNIRNPQGRCCLGNVRDVVKEVELERMSNDSI